MHTYEIKETTISKDFISLLPNCISFFLYEKGTYKLLLQNEANQHAFGMNSQSAAEQISNGTLEILYPDDREKLKLIFYKATVSGGIFREIVRFYLNGAYRWIAVAINAEPRPGGSTLLCMVFADINAQITKQKKLDSTYSELLDIMNNMPGGIISFDTLNNRILVPSFMSQGMCRILKGTEQQLKDHYFKDPLRCVHPDDKEKVVRLIEDALRNLSDFKISVRLKTIPGEYVWVACTGTIDTMENQRSVYIALIESSLDAQHLALEKRILDRFVNHQYDSVYYVEGKSGNCQILSSRQINAFLPEKNTKYEQALKRIVEKYVIKEEQKQFYQQMLLSSILAELQEHEEIEYFCTLKNEEGKLVYKNIWLSLIDGEEKSFAIVISDVTDQRARSMETMNVLHSALSAAEQANKAKTEFLSKMSHDLRTPLNAIIGYIGMSAEDPSISAEVREYLQKADASSRFLLTLINDILNMSRIESGKMILKEDAFSIQQFVDGIASIVNASCQQKQINFQTLIDENMQDYYYGDELKIQQVILNIVGNAIKFTPKNGTVSLRVKTIGSQGIRFEIEDTGCGISKEFLPHVFNAFEQENRSLDSEIKGTGLGLAICRSLTDMMGGKIDVASQVGVGTTFTVDLPLAAMHDLRHVTPQEKPSSSNNVDFRGKRVLLVEDNIVNMEIADHVLKKAGLQVEQAHNGKEACDMFKASSIGYYNAVIMDIRMPVMDGNEASRRIRASVRPDHDVPIIAMSANAFDEDIREAMRCGINEYTIKPIDVPALYATLQKYL